MTLDLEFRKGKVPSSLLPAIVGVNPWSGPLDAWLRITGRHDGGSTDGQAWGHYAEAALLRWYADREGCELAHFGSLAHPEHPWLIATPDAARAGARVVVECKNVGHRVAHHWTEEGPPDYVLVQAQAQMEVCDADRCDVVATIGGAAPETFRIERDRAMGALLVETARDFFLQHVQADDPPAFDGQTTAKQLEALFPRNRGELVEAPPDIGVALAEFAEARARREAAIAMMDAAKATVCAFIGERDGVASEQWRATWTWREPVTVAEHVRAGGRQFDVREVKAKKRGKAA